MTEKYWELFKTTVCIDVDGVINDFAGLTVKHEGPPALNEIPLMSGVKEAWPALEEMFKKIVIYTGRVDLTEVKELLDENNMQYSKIVNKPVACRYVDDQAIEFTNWENTLRRLRFEHTNGVYEKKIE